jgi:hypothetical protein
VAAICITGVLALGACSGSDQGDTTVDGPADTTSKAQYSEFCSTLDAVTQGVNTTTQGMPNASDEELNQAVHTWAASPEGSVLVKKMVDTAPGEVKDPVAVIAGLIQAGPYISLDRSVASDAALETWARDNCR